MRLLAVVLLLEAAGCLRLRDAAPGIGRRIAAGPARGLKPSPDGSSFAYLDRCARPPVPDLPADVLSCDLELVSTEGGAPKRIAEGVSSLAAGVGWSSDGAALAAIADYDYATGRGRLVLAEAGREPRTLGGDVGFFGFAPAGEALVFVSRGRLMVKQRGDGEPREVPGADAIATFEFNPQLSLRSTSKVPPLLLAARRASSAGGDLVGLARWEGEALRIAAQVGDYQFTPHGWLAFTARGREGYALAAVSTALERGSAGGWTPAAASPRVGANVQRFSFSPATGAIAFLANVVPGKPGDLFTVAQGGAGEPERVANAVGDYRWAVAAPSLAWLQDFDPRVRSGTLAVGGPGARPVTFGRNVDGYDIAPDASRVAYLEHVTAGGYSVDLKLAEVRAGAAPEVVARGVFGFAFSPDGRMLYYRTSCVRNGEACDLYVTGGAPGETPRRVAEGVRSFEFDRRRPGRLLLTWSRKDLVALDLGVLQDGKLIAVDQAALPGSAAFLGPESRRLAYIVADPKRAGVYVAELP